jgi:hypothetical protein
MAYYRAMKHLSRLLLTVGLISFASAVFASPRTIAVMEVDNQSDLSGEDLVVLRDLVTTVFKAAPRDQFVVGELETTPASDPESACAEECLVRKVGDAGADFAVYLAVSTLGESYVVLLKLYAAKTGQLLATETASSRVKKAVEVVAPLKWAAEKLRDALPVRRRPTPASLPARRQPASTKNKINDPNSGLLIVQSTPSGAAIYLGGRVSGHYVGETPFRKEMLSHRYRIVLQKKGYRDETRDFRLHRGETKHLHINLYTSKRFIAMGHGLIWPGACTTIIGLVLLTYSHKVVSGTITTAAGGTVVATGAALLVFGLVRLRREKASRNRNRFVFDAGPRRLALTYSRFF